MAADAFPVYFYAFSRRPQSNTCPPLRCWRCRPRIAPPRHTGPQSCCLAPLFAILLIANFNVTQCKCHTTLTLTCLALGGVLMDAFPVDTRSVWILCNIIVILSRTLLHSLNDLIFSLCHIVISLRILMANVTQHSDLPVWLWVESLWMHSRLLQGQCECCATSLLYYRKLDDIPLMI